MLRTRKLLRLLVLFLGFAGCVPIAAVQAASDPTRPPFAGASKVVHQDPLQLTMILNDNGRRRAVINANVVAVADTVAGARVISIREHEVVVARGGRQITLSLPMQAVRKESGK